MMPTYLVEAPVMGAGHKIGTASIEVEADSPEHARDVAREASIDMNWDDWDIDMDWDFDTSQADITEVD
jgi:hypothetical protein